MINQQSFEDAFGSITAASERLKVSRVTIYAWAKAGKIPKKSKHGLTAGKHWHKKLRLMGFDPMTLKPL